MDFLCSFVETKTINMSFSDLFDSGFRNRNKGHFSAIVRVALSDGIITPEEQELGFKTLMQQGRLLMYYSNLVFNFKFASFQNNFFGIFN